MSSYVKNFGGHVRAVLTGLKYLVKPNRITVYYPEYYVEPPEGYRGMIKYYPEKCIQCGLCAMICPAGAMKMYVKKGEKKGRPGVNYQRCIFCGFCVDICPQDALEMTKVHDVAFSSLEELVFPPEKLAVEVQSPALLRGAVKVKPVFDEERGLRHE
ncbi:NuoI/complex I 23 kDa subunit family protein [Thermofilum pendens]|uniref:NADH-quinone oxidoreductase, chain I n=1 Tax=Thermofilum pendens (strain DSM 2475 / Hrk 5) TaxID=368408 RepID=A1RZ52_THEPD|nr:NADH-quinone oxidoreductase subunit I [Thermofilum pendens]ABL78482.1 NADH-quinone oxidoreductase, chain I [Thermofilum pendens Hrk 5]